MMAANGSEGAAVGEDIAELKRYIVDMMHSEMEMVESIKQSEDNMALVSARIERVKESILREQDRYKALTNAIESDKQELMRVEETQIVAAAKHRQFLDDVMQQEKDASHLREEYASIRMGLLSLRMTLTQMTTHVDGLAASETQIGEELSGVRQWLEAIPVNDELTSKLSKLRAKARYVSDYTTQVQQDADAAHQKRVQLAQDLKECDRKVDALELSIQREELQVESVQSRIREETLQLEQETKRIEQKLEVKRKKYRTKTRTEICSLKKRMHFMTTQMETETMMSEDVASYLRDRCDERHAEEDSLKLHVKQIDAMQAEIATLGQEIGNFDRNDTSFNTAALEAEIGQSQRELDHLQYAVKQNEALLQQRKEEYIKLEQNLGALEEERSKVECQLADADSDSAQDSIVKLEAEKSQVLDAITSASENSELLQIGCKKYRSAVAAAKKEVARRTRHSTRLKQQLQEKTSEIEAQQILVRKLNAGVEHGRWLLQELEKFRADLDFQRTQYYEEIQDDEKRLQQHYLEREAAFEAELKAWEAKIAELQ